MERNQLAPAYVSTLFKDPDSLEPLVDYGPSSLLQVPDMHLYTRTVRHTYTQHKKPKVTNACTAKLPRESLVSETGSNMNVSANEIEDRSRTGMCYREDNQDRSASCSTDAEVVAP